MQTITLSGTPTTGSNVRIWVNTFMYQPGTPGIVYTPGTDFVQWDNDHPDLFEIIVGDLVIAEWQGE